jgi:hypothetical protein
MSGCTIRRLQIKYELVGGERRSFTQPIPQKDRTVEGEVKSLSLGPSAPYSRYRAFLHCPVCLKQILTLEQARLVTNLIDNRLYEEAEIYLSTHGLRLFLLEPVKTETKQLLSHRIVVGAVCKSHRQIDFQKIEQTVVLASRYGQVTKETL